MLQYGMLTYRAVILIHASHCTIFIVGFVSTLRVLYERRFSLPGDEWCKLTIDCKREILISVF